MDRPEVHYAPVDGAHVAYQVFGDGPIDIVYQGGWYSHVDGSWDLPPLARFLERMATFARVIAFDRRGHGMSDPIDLGNITLEQWMEDLTAVVTAVGSDQHVLVGTTESGPMQIMYAATYPERTRALVLHNATACFARRDGYAIGMPETYRHQAATVMRRVILGQGTPEEWAAISPEGATNARFRDSTLRMIRYATSPAMIQRLMEVSMELDVRDLLTAVRAPTLILHREFQPFVRAAHGRYLAEHIPHAKYVELPGSDLQMWASGESGSDVLVEIEEFVTGTRPVHERDRVLATVLFTDIVASTEHAVAAGDRRWLDTLDRHNAIVRRALGRYRGREVHTAGDGFMATFDGPARAVRCARYIADEVANLGLHVRAGLHTGEVELAGSDIGGIAVHIGRRVSDLARPGEVLVSRTLVDLVAGSGLSFADRGAHSLKGVPGEWRLYAVER